MKLYLSAGHSKSDPGATFGFYTESELVMRIRDELAKIVPNGIVIPDTYSLRQTIDWINQSAQPDDLAVEIHLNFSNNPNLSGTEAYYSDNYTLANTFSQCLAESLDVVNRGAKHDSEAAVGSLGFLRQLKCKSVLVECCYLSNLRDRLLITSQDGQRKAAQGIFNGIIKAGYGQSILDYLRSLLAELIKKYAKL